MVVSHDGGKKWLCCQVSEVQSCSRGEVVVVVVTVGSLNLSHK